VVNFRVLCDRIKKDYIIDRYDRNLYYKYCCGFCSRFFD